MTMTMDFQNETSAQAAHSRHHQMPASVQVVSTILFAAFAIPVTIVALNIFWPAGVAIALILAWRGGFAPTGPAAAPPKDMSEAVQSLVPTTAQKSSGNASFDAYRASMIDRLEQEQTDFEAFLARLRTAKDQSEFDRYMDDRAARSALDEDAGRAPLDD